MAAFRDADGKTVYVGDKVKVVGGGAVGIVKTVIFNPGRAMGIEVEMCHLLPPHNVMVWRPDQLSGQNVPQMALSGKTWNVSTITRVQTRFAVEATQENIERLQENHISVEDYVRRSLALIPVPDGVQMAGAKLVHLDVDANWVRRADAPVFRLMVTAVFEVEHQSLRGEYPADFGF